METPFARIIPILQIDSRKLVKTKQFKNPKYIGDPLNAIKIFNDKGVDELMIIDIGKTKDGSPDFEFISDLVSECFMPISYGGGICNMHQAERVFNLGIEKLVINSAAIMNPKFVCELAYSFGSQAIAVSCDYKRTLFHGLNVYSKGGQTNTRMDPIKFCKSVTDNGAGEIILRSIERDGMYSGYDLPTLKLVTKGVSVPVVASCGAGSEEDMVVALNEGGAAAVSAASMFVYYGKHRGVLINTPNFDGVRNAIQPN